jgi:hypothetical protein
MPLLESSVGRSAARRTSHRIACNEARPVSGRGPPSGAMCLGNVDNRNGREWKQLRSRALRDSGQHRRHDAIAAWGVKLERPGRDRTDSRSHRSPDHDARTV